MASAQDRIADVNPDVKVVVHEEPITSENAMQILGQYDIVVNGSDNFATRYLVNDAAYLLGKPLVDGSIFRFEGQATVFMPGKGCYRCLFPSPPPPGRRPELCRGRRAGRAARHDWGHPGHRDDQADPRPG